MTWRRLPSTVAVAFAFVAPTLAADLPAKAEPVARAAAYNWSGCYIGGNAGWIQSAGTQDVYLINYGLTPAETEVSRNSYSPHGSGFTGGGQVGCNLQSPGSMFVYGIEADLNGSSLNESAAASYGSRVLSSLHTADVHTETVSNRLDWYSTVRGRVGVTTDRWLAYVTGGLAIGHPSATTNYLVASTNFLFSLSGAQTRAGWTAGGGVEYAFAGNWSAKLEYLYLDFGKFSYFDTQLNPPVVGSDLHARDHVVRVGLNYKFGGLPF